MPRPSRMPDCAALRSRVTTTFAVAPGTMKRHSTRAPGASGPLASLSQNLRSGLRIHEGGEDFARRPADEHAGMDGLFVHEPIGARTSRRLRRSMPRPQLHQDRVCAVIVRTSPRRLAAPGSVAHCGMSEADRITTAVHATAALTPAQWDDIWTLTEEFFDVERDYAEAELRQRQSIAMFRMNDSLLGMAAIDVSRHEFRGRTLIVIYTAHVLIRESLARPQPAAEARAPAPSSRRACAIRCGLSTGSSTPSATRATCCCRAISAHSGRATTCPTPEPRAALIDQLATRAVRAGLAAGARGRGALGPEAHARRPPRRWSSARAPIRTWTSSRAPIRATPRATC